MSEPKVELFYHPVSFFSQKAYMFLLEKGIKPTTRVIAFHDGENLTDEYLRLNPEGNVPVIRVDCEVIPDSDAIMRKCEELPGPTLAPPDIREAVWKLHDEIHGLPVEIITYGAVLHKPYSDHVKVPGFAAKQIRRRVYDDQGRTQKFRNYMESASADMKPLIKKKIAMWDERARQMRSEEELSRCLADLEKVLDTCERHLASSGGPFLFGSRFTAADVDLAVLLFRLDFLGLETGCLERRPALTGFRKAVGQRASVRQLQSDFRRALVGAVVTPRRLMAVAVLVAAVALGVMLFRRR